MTQAGFPQAREGPGLAVGRTACSRHEADDRYYVILRWTMDMYIFLTSERERESERMSGEEGQWEKES